MAYTTGMSKERKKIFNSGSDEDMKNYHQKIKQTDN
jgi:hypothetical protein